MAKLELPVYAFVEDFVKRAFPDRDWSRGSAISDLVIKAHAALIQPLRHEIDAIKVNQSIVNYPYMRREDLDALAANWGKFRQAGSRSFGLVRMYFDRAADFSFSFLEFEAVDGTLFVLQAPVRISTTELLQNRRTDGTFFFDVAVQSVGVGSRYALAAGSIVGIRNAPDGVVRVENLEDFEVTAPDESNFDVVNSLFRNLGLRNLVSRSSIRTPILDNFPGVLDIFIAGADHAQMVRDLLTVEINNIDVDLHLGGMTDVWLNTTSIGQREVIFSYLPSLRRLKLISADQAQDNELLYAFSALLLSLDGQYSSPNFGDTDLDEASGLFVDQAGLPFEAFVIDTEQNDRHQVAAQDVVSGNDLMATPILGNGDVPEVRSVYLTDPVGINFHNTSMAVGDYLRLGSNYHRIVALSGRIIEVSPPISVIGSITFDDVGGTVIVAPGDRFVPSTGAAALALVNDRAVLPHGNAAGHYRVLAVDGTGIWVGNPVAEGELVYVSDDAGVYTYTLQGPAAAVAELPADIDETCWIYFGADGAYDQTPALWAKILTVERTPAGVTITTQGGTGSPGAITVVRGLRDGLTDGTVVYFERDGDASFGKAVIQDTAKGHTLYSNVVQDDIALGVDEISSLGLGLLATPGDLLLFDGAGLEIESSDLPKTGGDGTRVTLVVRDIIDDDTVQVLPALSFDIPAGTRFVLMRNDIALASVTADAVSGSNVTVNSWPLGLGDGLGMPVLANEDIALNLTLDEIEDLGNNVAKLHFNGAPSLADIRAGDSATVAGTSSDGTYTVLGVDDVAKTALVSGSLSDEVFGVPTGDVDITGDRLYVIRSSTAGNVRTLKFQAPQTAIDVTFQASGYVSASPNDIGAPVRQTVGGTTYAGVLRSYDNSTRTWTILPNDPATDLFATSVTPGEEIEVVNGAAEGLPSTIGSGYQVGYFDPAGGDVGLLVRQGTYVGILDSFIGSPTFEWKVKPLSEFDIFDRTDLLTYVDRGTGEPTTNDAQGTLRVPALAPEVNAGSVVVTLDRAPGFGAAASIDVHSRFGRHGGFFDGRKFRVYDDAAINSTPFTGVSSNGDDELLVLMGDNVDRYPIIDVNDVDLEVSGAAALADVVRISNAPAEQALELAAPIAAGATSLVSPGSDLGIWGHAGRILILRVSGATYYLTISGPNTEDGVNLADPLPVALYPSQGARVEIVEGYHLPFWVVDTAQFSDYRVFRVLDIGEVLIEGTRGTHTSSAGQEDQFSDPSLDFTALIGYGDFDGPVDDLLLFLDSGPEASVTPFPIRGNPSTDTIEIDHAFTNDANELSYHIVRKNAGAPLEKWYSGTILANNQIKLEVPDDWDFDRYYSRRMWVVELQAHPDPFLGIDDPTFDPPPVSVEDYDPVTKILTLDVALDHVAEYTLATIWDTDSAAAPRGFQDDILERKVRVMVRLGDRIAARNLAGSVVNTYNYYTGTFFTLPVVRIQAVQQLNPETLQPVKDLPYNLVVNDKGLRYSHKEDIEIEVTDVDAVFQPVRVAYIADPSIESVNEYLNDPDTRVLNANQLAKRMETISVSISVSVRSDRTAAQLSALVAQYINTLRSTERLSKDSLIRYLYQNGAVSFIDVDSLIINATYYKLDGGVETFTDASEVFGADTACYLSNVVSVTKLTGLSNA